MILENMNIFSYIYTKESYKDTIDNKIPRIFSNSFLFYNNSSEFVNLFFSVPPCVAHPFPTDWLTGHVPQVMSLDSSWPWSCQPSQVLSSTRATKTSILIG